MAAAVVMGAAAGERAGAGPHLPDDERETWGENLGV